MLLIAQQNRILMLEIRISKSSAPVLNLFLHLAPCRMIVKCLHPFSRLSVFVVGVSEFFWTINTLILWLRESMIQFLL